MIGVRAEVTRAFFDTKKVIAATDKNTRRALNRIGGRVRKTAQYSMRPGRGKVSPAGSPPYTHKKKLLKRMLFYAWDAQKKSVVIGPVLLQRTRGDKIPGLLEQGGTRTGITKQGKPVLYQYPSHAYMSPALATNQGFITQAFDMTKGKGDT